MSERLTSKADAFYMKKHVNDLVNRLEHEGFDRGQIGAVIGGIGLGLCCAHNGKEETNKIIDGVRMAMDADAAPSN